MHLFQFLNEQHSNVSAGRHMHYHTQQRCPKKPPFILNVVFHKSQRNYRKEFWKTHQEEKKKNELIKNHRSS